MSRERYLKALRCQNPEVIPHQLWLLHPEFISHATGVDYYEHPLQAALRFHARFDVDNGGPVHVMDTPLPRPKTGKTADGGERSDEGFGTVWHQQSPFTEPEQLWDFDPDPWGPDANQAVEPNYALQNYRTGQTLRRLGDVTARMYEYFATCDGALFISPHDDLCITSGPVTVPEWYRTYIYPQYEKIFAPVKAAGKPVILTSDGDISKLAPDLADVVDGFIFESSTPAEYMLNTFGQRKCLVGGIDVRPLTFGTPADVEAEVKKAIDRGRDCPGYVIACADTIPANVPIANVYAYFDAVEKYRRR